MQPMFSEIPVLENERILLRKVVDSDAQALESLVRNDRIYRYLPTFLFEKQYLDMHRMIAEL
ncbi:MAG: hypothetical protein IJI77_08275, partial [Erysipelotrichaceae bacterium]|nr:hypothetical protein [Erysipelotrichaceae bacterium]